MSQMKTFLTILVAILMLATLGVLFAGLFGLVRGGGNPAAIQQADALARHPPGCGAAAVRAADEPAEVLIRAV